MNKLKSHEKILHPPIWQGPKGTLRKLWKHSFTKNVQCLNNISVPWVLQSNQICTTHCSKEAKGGIAVWVALLMWQQLLYLGLNKGLWVLLTPVASFMDSAVSVVLLLRPDQMSLSIFSFRLGSSSPYSLFCSMESLGAATMFCPESPRRLLHWLGTLWLPLPSLQPLTAVPVPETGSAHSWSPHSWFLPKAKNAEHGHKYN